MARTFEKSDRSFLGPNRQQNTSIAWSVNYSHGSVDADIIIAEDTKGVNLNFFCYGNAEDNMDQLVKLDDLLHELATFRASLVEAVAMMHEDQTEGGETDPVEAEKVNQAFANLRESLATGEPLETILRRQADAADHNG